MSLYELWVSIVNTVVILALSLTVALPVGTILGIVLQRTNIVGRQFLWIALGSQIAIPLYVFAGGWSAGLGFQGWITALGIWDFLGLTGGQSVAVAFAPGTRAALIAVAFVHAFAAIPWVTFIVAFGLRRVDRSQEEQAFLDGGWVGTALRVVLPKLRIWIFAAGLWTTVPIMTEMVISNLYQVPTIAEQVYLDASRGAVSPFTYLSSFAFATLPVAIVLLIGLRKLPAWKSVLARESQHLPTIWQLGKLRGILSTSCWVIVLLLVGLPIFNLIAKAGWQPALAEDGTAGYSWQASRFLTTCYETATLFDAEFFWSFLLAVASSSCAMLTAGTLLAVCSGRMRIVTSIACVVAIAIPGPMVGMFVIWCLNRSTPATLGYLYDYTIVGPVLAQQFRLLPLAWLFANAILSSISKVSWEQAKLDGLGRLDTCKSILLPQTGSLWCVAWLLLFALSIGELSCTIMILPPGVSTVSIRLFEMLHFGMRHQDSGLCGALTLLGWCISLALWKTLKDR